MDELTQYYYSIYPGLVSAMETEGIDPRWAGIVAPQVMIETSWGKSPATKHHNYFGMKAAKDQNGVTFSTNEGYGDDTIRIRDSFLAFPSREEGLRQGVRRLRDKFNAFEGKPSTEQYVKNINSNPEQIYFTGNPEDYINNINNIKNGSRAKAAVKQYAKDVRNTFLKAQSPAPNPSDATRVVKPQPIFTPRGDVKKAMQDKVDYHNLMNSISIQNNPQPVYNPPMKFDDGGRISDKQYYYIMEKVAEDNYRKWGFSTPDEALTHALNDNTYNYRGFYDKYPHSKADADTHWTDEFKTVWHPTFSDESIYSGNKSQFNPQGIHGGHWYGENFVPSVEQVIENNSYSDGGELYHPKQWNDLTMAEKAEMMKVAVQNGITTLPEIRERYNEFAKGGYIPSDRIKDKITHYEGKAMTGAIDPLSGKYSKNNSFESEAKGFYNALPEDIRDQVLSNPELADSLYSYSYNVGAGNFKKRVVPTLRRYYQGNATVSDIERSMWASGDSKLRGLQRRRAEERAGVRSALAGNNPIYSTMLSDSENLPFTPFYNEAFNTPLSSYNVPTVTLPIEEPLVQAAEDYAYSKEALDRQERQNRLNAFNMLLGMSSPNSSGNSLMDTIGMLTGNSFAQGGRKYDGLTQDSQQMSNPLKPNIFRRSDGSYFYQEKPSSQEINVTPMNTVFDDPSQWTYVDDEGRQYTPHQLSVNNTGTITQGEDSNPLVKAANNYFRELAYRSTYDPASLALQGKYTMPVIAASALLPIAGEYVAGTSIAGVPTMTWADTALTTGFGAHGLNKFFRGEINGPLDGAMTALEVAPLGRLAKPVWNASKEGLRYTAKVADNTARYVSPSYDLHRIISETTPRTTPTYHGFYTSGLTRSALVENVHTGSPLFEFGQTMRTSPEKAYFMSAPKDVDILKLRNGRFRHEVVGNETLPSGEVNGKFVSYGEPWQEFALGENSALYKFPVGPRRGPSLMATDWKGRPQRYSIDEIYDYMQQERALRKELDSIKKTMGDDEFLKQYYTIRRNLIDEKYPILNEPINTSVYGANQTVIPNERWNFDKFLKTPFWKYSENPISGQVQKELMMKWPEAKPLETPTIEWADAVRTPQITAENAKR